MIERTRQRREYAKDWTGVELTHGKVLGEAGVGKWNLECKYCGEIHVVDSRPLIYDRHTRRCKAWRVHNYKGTVEEKNIRKKYGIDMFQYAELLATQNGGCAICGVTEDRTGKMLSVDHDHATGKIRGILCHSCNHGIGVFYENQETLLKAVEYLKKHAPSPAR